MSRQHRQRGIFAALQHVIYLDVEHLSATIKWDGDKFGAVAMPIPRRVIPKTPPIGQRRCPACGLPLFLGAVNPTEVADEDERVFECTECAYAEMVIVQFR